MIDTGIGIATSDLEKIFDYFEQVNNEQHLENSKGSGLGLAICTKIVNLLNGKISVKSEVDVGSEFMIELYNIHVSSAKELQQQENFNAQAYVFDKAKLLIVDDIADNRKLISLFFAATNIETFEAANGVEALEFLEKNQVDLVLLDIKMPILDGYATIEKIKNEYHYAMPIVALTASVMGEDSYKIAQYQFDGYLRKPVSQDELFAEIAKFLPYKTIVHANENEALHLTISTLMKNNKTEVLAQLDEFLQECEKIKDKGDFSLIEEFALKIKEFAQHYEQKELENYCVVLLQNIESFEISNVRKMLNDFANIVKQVSKELGNV